MFRAPPKEEGDDFAALDELCADLAEAINEKKQQKSNPFAVKQREKPNLKFKEFDQPVRPDSVQKTLCERDQKPRERKQATKQLTFVSQIETRSGSRRPRDLTQLKVLSMPVKRAAPLKTAEPLEKKKKMSDIFGAI